MLTYRESKAGLRDPNEADLFNQQPEIMFHVCFKTFAAATLSWYQNLNLSFLEKELHQGYTMHHIWITVEVLIEMWV